MRKVGPVSSWILQERISSLHPIQKWEIRLMALVTDPTAVFTGGLLVGTLLSLLGNLFVETYFRWVDGKPYGRNLMILSGISILILGGILYSAFIRSV